MAANSFENYLYKKHRAVYVSPLMTDLQLLDVLIKTDREGLVPPRPVLQKVGSMVTLGTGGSAFYEETLTRLRKGLENFERSGEGAEGEEYLFKWHTTNPHINVTFRSAASITGTLLSGFAVDANLHLNSSRNVNCRLRAVQIACVDKNELLHVILANPPHWKPDVDNRALKWPQPSCVQSNSTREMWVVYEILYAAKLVVKSGDSVSAGGSITGGAAQVASGPGGSLAISHTAAGSLEAHADGGKRFRFAFRAMRFQFDAAGALVRHAVDAGKSVPVYRGHNDDVSVFDDPRAQLGGLFSHPPGIEHDADQTDLQRLEIIQITAA